VTSPPQPTKLRRMKHIARTMCALCLAFVAVSIRAQAPQKKSSSDAKSTKSAKSAEKDTSPVLVRVNGHAITEADLQFFVTTRKLTAEDLGDRRDVLIERLIEQQLLRAFLARKKIAADPKLVDERFTRLKLWFKERSEDFDKLLAKTGFTEETLRRELSLPLDWETYARTINTDAKLRDVWKQRQHEFDGSEVRAAHIVLKSDNPDADEKTLKELRSQIVAKEISFADAAKKYSQSPSAEKGGDLGRFGFRGKLSVYPQVAFALKIGEVSEPFRSPFGVHLLTVTERIDGQLSLEDARPEILQELSIELQREVLSQERAKAKIERTKNEE
jgi:parvulin-like peptidyl-prolyl isomerase